MGPRVWGDFGILGLEVGVGDQALGFGLQGRDTLNFVLSYCCGFFAFPVA